MIKSTRLMAIGLVSSKGWFGRFSENNCHVWFKIKICLLIANLRLELLSGCGEPSKTKAFLQLPNISNGAQENVRQWLQPHPLLALFASTLSSSRTSPPLCGFAFISSYCHWIIIHILLAVFDAATSFYILSVKTTLPIAV